MPNEKQLALLEHGAAEWNQWRADNPEAIPDLAGADLARANLTEANVGWVRGRDLKASLSGRCEGEYPG